MAAALDLRRVQHSSRWEAHHSCTLPVSQAAGKSVTTIEGLVRTVCIPLQKA